MIGWKKKKKKKSEILSGTEFGNDYFQCVLNFSLTIQDKFFGNKAGDKAVENSSVINIFSVNAITFPNKKTPLHTLCLDKNKIPRLFSDLKIELKFLRLDMKFSDLQSMNSVFPWCWKL